MEERQNDKKQERQKCPAGTRQTDGENWGLVWRNRKKISQIIKDYFQSPFFLIIILCLTPMFFASKALLLFWSHMACPPGTSATGAFLMNPLSLVLLATLVFATSWCSIVAVFYSCMAAWVSLLLLGYPCCCSYRRPLLFVANFLARVAVDHSVAGFTAVLTCLLSLVSLLLLSCSCCLCLILAGVPALAEVLAAAVSLIWLL